MSRSKERGVSIRAIWKEDVDLPEGLAVGKDKYGRRFTHYQVVFYDSLPEELLPLAEFFTIEDVIHLPRYVTSGPYGINTAVAKIKDVTRQQSHGLDMCSGFHYLFEGKANNVTDLLLLYYTIQADLIDPCINFDVINRARRDADEFDTVEIPQPCWIVQTARRIRQWFKELEERIQNDEL